MARVGQASQPQIPTTYTGPTWVQIYGALSYAVETVNGRSGKYPRISNGLAIAILEGFRKLATAYKQFRSPFWPSLWYAALGYRKEGDKFQMATSHALAAAPPDVTAAVWEYVMDQARKLDQVGAQPKLLVIDVTYKSYEAAAKSVYDALQAERKKKKVPFPGPRVPGTKPPPDVELPPEIPGGRNPVPTPGDGLPSIPSLKGAGVLALIILIALAMRKRK